MRKGSPHIICLFLFISISRASKLLNEIRLEEFEMLKGERKYPRILPGDSIAISKLPYMSAKEPDVVKGVVIAKTNKQGDSGLTIINVRRKER
jgi:hypothetical protein